MRDHHDAGCSLRDRLTQEWLASSVGIAEADVVEYDAAWWDGTAYDRCVVVDVDGRRMRIVEEAGEAVVVPMSRRAAARLLAERRQVRASELTVPAPRPPSLEALQLVVLDADDSDVVRCSRPDCGALRPIADAAPCPRCGAAAR